MAEFKSTMRLIILTGALGLGLQSCAPMPPPTVPPPTPEQNQCHALDYQYLVGQRRSHIPQQPAGATWRVSCSSCAVTMDYNPRRMNVVYDDRTEIVQSVSCG